jgi:hypothetical protein
MTDCIMIILLVVKELIFYMYLSAVGYIATRTRTYQGVPHLTNLIEITRKFTKGDGKR